MQKILVIDVDDCLRDAIGALLEQASYMPLYAADAKEGYEKALALKPNLLVVDLGLSKISGFDICRQLRKANLATPIIVISAINDELEKVVLLEMGADDYIVKPFGSRELLARIKAVLRRYPGDSARVRRFADVEIDLDRRIVMCRGAEVNLTPYEYNLLVFFLDNADRVLARDVILKFVWGGKFKPKTRTVDAHVAKLRKKLEARPRTPSRFVTVRGVGYCFLLEKALES